MLLQHFIVISCVAGIIATTVRRLLAFCGVDVHKANAGFLRLQRSHLRHTACHGIELGTVNEILKVGPPV